MAGGRFPLYTECTDVSGSGLHINYLRGYFVNQYPSPTDNVHIELYGPNGVIKNCGSYTATTDNTSHPCRWSPNAKEKGGNYCSRAWQYNGGGNYEEIAEECVDVHS
jgi:hypothetical protein